MKSHSLMRLCIIGTILFLGCSVFVLTIPVPANAVSTACIRCGLGPKDPPCGQVCPDNTNPQCVGVCTPGVGGDPQQCKAIKCTQGDGSESKAGAGGAEQVMKMAQDLLGKLMQGGGGGGGGDTPQTPVQQPTTPTLGDSLLNNLGDLSSGSSSIGAALSNITDSLLNGGTAELPKSTVTTTFATSTATTTSSDAADDTDATTKKPSLATGFEKPKSGFGAFFGGEGVINSICKSKPWETSVVSQIFPPAFFDSLCLKVGYVESRPAAKAPTAVAQVRAKLSCPAGARPGDSVVIAWQCPAGSRSSGVGFDTNGLSRGEVEVAVGSSTRRFDLACGQGGSDSCVVEVVHPVVQIVAHPARVPLGTRSKVFWTSSGVVSCEIIGPNFKETGVQGAATTGTILESTPFTITCKTAGGITVTESTTIDIGK